MEIVLIVLIISICTLVIVMEFSKNNKGDLEIIVGKFKISIKKNNENK